MCKAMITEKEKIVHEDKNVAEIINGYFINTTKTLNLKL